MSAHFRRFQPMLSVFPTARMRPSPIYESALAKGMTGASIDHRMMMPSTNDNHRAECWRLITGVLQWNVSADRQVQLKGPKPQDVVAPVMDDWMHGLKFWFYETEITVIPVAVQRLGLSKPGRFEMSLKVGTKGMQA